MNYLIVDDEIIILEGMADSLRNVVEPEDKIYKANDPYDAIALAKKYPMDAVLTDVDMPGMDGLKLASKLTEIKEDTYIVFTTGYAHYSLDAWRTAAKAFILKPVGEDEIREALDKFLKEKKRQEEAAKEVALARSMSAEGTMHSRDGVDIEAMCFGNFELFYQGKPIHFTRKKSKEMLAYLIDRKGAMMSVDQIRTILWGEDEDTEEKQGYVRVLANDIRKTFNALGAENILKNEQNGYFVDTTAFACDYYKFLEEDPKAINAFAEEYMAQYSWAEPTLAKLLKMV